VAVTQSRKCYLGATEITRNLKKLSKEAVHPAEEGTWDFLGGIGTGFFPALGGGRVKAMAANLWMDGKKHPKQGAAISGSS